MSAYRKISATYDYVDEQCELLFQVVRFDPKDFRQRRPDGNGGWTWDLNGTRRVLFRLDGLIAHLSANSREPIYIVEGEKDVLAIEAAGGTATCNPMGAGKWSDECSETLQGARRVVVVQDNDELGEQHARDVVASLGRFGVVAEHVRPAVGKDASDHLAAGGTLDDFEPVPITGDTAADDAEPQPSPIVFVTLREFLKLDFPKAESLIGHQRNGTNLLPRYGWVMPWGPAGSTKTSLLVDLVFQAAAGRPWLDFPILRPLRFVLIVNEGVPGGLQDKLDEKLELWDDEPIDEQIAVYASPWGEFSFQNDRMFRHLQDFARDFAADYVVGDPLHTLGTVGAGTPQDTEEFKHRLRTFGVWDWIGILSPHHSNRNGMVSGDWSRHPDTVIRLEKVAKQPQTKFTLEKARPADPAELDITQILEWVLETKSYRRLAIERHEKVSDAEILARIYTVIADEPEISMTDLQTLAKGDTKRVARLVKDEIEAGRILNVSPKKGTYKLRLPDVGAAAETDNTDDLEWR
jgi:hypothetical protein